MKIKFKYLIPKKTGLSRQNFSLNFDYQIFMHSKLFVYKYLSSNLYQTLLKTSLTFETQ